MIETSKAPLREMLLSTIAAPQAPTHTLPGPRELLDKEEVLTVEEACRISRLSRATVYRHLAAGTLTAFKLGGRTVFRTEDLRRFMSGKTWERSNAAA